MGMSARGGTPRRTKMAKALGGAGVVDEGAFDAPSGLRSVPSRARPDSAPGSRGTSRSR